MFKLKKFNSYEEYCSVSLGESPHYTKIPPKGIPVAVQRELDARFQEQNELLECMMQRLEALNNHAPALPELSDVAAAEDKALALWKPVQQV